MKAELEPLDGTPIARLVVAESDPELAAPGEVVGYWCTHCRQADETRQQIIHEENCPLAGRHGRHYYGADLGPIDWRDVGEMRPDTTFTMIRAASADAHLGIGRGEVLAFRCDECQNLDEALWTVVHDHGCTLAGTPEDRNGRRGSKTGWTPPTPAGPGTPEVDHHD